MDLYYCELCNTMVCSQDHHCLEKQEKKKEQLKRCPYCDSDAGPEFISGSSFMENYVNDINPPKYNIIGVRFACGTERQQSKLWGWDDTRSTHCYQREIRKLKGLNL